MADWQIPPNTRAIIFDAFDTLIEPDPPVIDVYRQTGLRHGCDISSEKMVRRFREAFRSEEQVDAAGGWKVSEERERERWKNIVSRVFGGCPALDAIFAELWSHFAQSASWRVAESAGVVLSGLAIRGFVLGLASNFDRRLHAIADGLTALSPARLRIVSSEVGWRKPSPQFFAAVVTAAKCEARQVLFIGDRRDTDYDGAIAAGLRALLLDPDMKAPSGVRRIGSLKELLTSGPV